MLFSRVYYTQRQLSPPLFVKNNVLYDAAEPGEINHLISDTLIDKKSKEILTSIKEDNNPIIVKYFSSK